MRCRPHYVTATRTGYVILDTMSTNDASPEAVGKTLANEGLLFNGAACVDGLWRTIQQPATYLLLAYETTAPFSAALYCASDKLLEHATVQYRRALAKYLECVQADSWPGYEALGIVTLDPM